MPWITPADLSGYRETYIERGARSLSTKGYESSGARLMPASTVLYSSRAPIGYCVIARKPVSTNQGFKSLILRPGLVPEFVRHYLVGAKRYIEGLASGTTFLEISGRRMAEVEVPVAPLEEQQRIVEAIEAHFSRLDAAVASLSRAKANVKRGRASVLKAAVEGRLVPTEAALARAEGRDYEPAAVLLDRILAERKEVWGGKSKYKEPSTPDTSGLSALSEGWIWASVDQLNSTVTDGDHQPPPVAPEGVPFLVIGDVRSGLPSFEGCRRVSTEYFDGLDDKRRPDSNDLLYTVVGSLGIPVRVPDGQPFCVQRHIAILKRPLAGTKAYLLRAMSSGLVFRQAEGKATGTAQKTLGLLQLRSIAIPLPPLAEQRRIVAEVDRRLSVLDALDASIDANLARCARLRQSILKRAFEGRLVPPSAD